jgi:hypothetical protein
MVPGGYKIHLLLIMGMPSKGFRLRHATTLSDMMQHMYLAGKGSGGIIGMTDIMTLMTLCWGKARG